MVNMEHEAIVVVLFVFLVRYNEGIVNTEYRQVTKPVTSSGSLFWDAGVQSLYYADTLGNSVHLLKYGSNQTTCTNMSVKQIGSVIPFRDSPNQLIVAAKRDIFKLEWDGTEGTGREKKLSKLGDFGPNQEINKGAADSKGRLWLSVYQPVNKEKFQFASGGGGIYCVTVYKNGTACIKKKLGGLTFPNGVAFSEDNKFFYQIESSQILKYEFDAESGNIEKSRLLFDLKKYPEYKGFPDSLAIDKKGVIGVSLNQGSTVLHIHPDSGEILEDFPALIPNPTSVHWGDPDFKTGYIASSRQSLDQLALKLNPYESGAVFALTGINSQGFGQNKVVLI